MSAKEPGKVFLPVSCYKPFTLSPRILLSCFLYRKKKYHGFAHVEKKVGVQLFLQ